MDSERIRELVYKSYSSKPSYMEIMPGVPEDYRRIETLGQLLEINYKYISVDEQMKRNLVAKRRSKRNPYPGIIGYDDVIAATDRAILAGHDIIYIGKIGQAKTKLAETIARNLLSPIPAIKGCIIHDIPTTLLPAEELARLLSGSDPEHTSLEFHICNECEYKIRDEGLDTRIEWVDGMSRYRYVLATPDISIKDLVGQIDATKVAKGATLYSIESYSPGQLLQARHGILCIDELPVLDPRKQVVLLSVLQEGKFTTGSYPVIFKPYVRVIATANPVDYTHASKIIEPLVDRFESHIVTHYPYTLRDEMAIMVQEAKVDYTSSIILPIFMLKLVARITHLAREHPDVNKEKGVSVRMSIHSLELLISEAMRVRALYNDAIAAVPRPSDIYAIVPAAKFELSELEDSSENRRRVLEQMMEESLKQTSIEYIMDITQEQLASIREEFKGRSLIISQTSPWSDGGGSGSSSSNSSNSSNERGDGYNDDDGSGGIEANHENAYSIQLARFKTLLSLIDNVMLKVEKEHIEFMEYLKRHGIDTTLLEIGENSSYRIGELKASIFELVLEGLRHMRPPVLDRRERGVYVAT
ncbi:MAG: AAA family ATPase [Candidatus Nitrosocaldus sp.]